MDIRKLHRGKRKDNGEWVEGFYAEFQLGINSVPFIGASNSIGTMMWFEVYPETVGQCTGLHTVTEHRIWEGDIVQRNGTKYVVQRECDTPGGYWAETGYILKEIGVCDYISFVDTIDEYCNEICVQIIGNIHDDYDRPGGAQ